MSVDEDLLESSAPTVVRDTSQDRRRPGRLQVVAPGLIPLLRDPAKFEIANRASPTLAVTLALIVVCLCIALGYAMRGLP